MEHLEEGRFCDCMGCDNDFHASIVRMPELPRLYTAWEALSGGSIAACDAGGADRLAVVRRQYPVHRQLYDICRTGEMQAVCDAIMEHYMGTVRRCLSERGLPQPSFHLAADLHL